MLEFCKLLWLLISKEILFPQKSSAEQRICLKPVRSDNDEDCKIQVENKAELPFRKICMIMVSFFLMMSSAVLL